jgi:hypothetical protein
MERAIGVVRDEEESCFVLEVFGEAEGFEVESLEADFTI